jgi:hypothetical protein
MHHCWHFRNTGNNQRMKNQRLSTYLYALMSPFFRVNVWTLTGSFWCFIREAKSQSSQDCPRVTAHANLGSPMITIPVKTYKSLQYHVAERHKSGLSACMSSDWHITSTMQELELFSNHEMQMEIRQFGAIASSIQM